jgi:hypothetical protein
MHAPTLHLLSPDGTGAALPPEDRLLCRNPSLHFRDVALTPILSTTATGPQASFWEHLIDGDGIRFPAAAPSIENQVPSELWTADMLRRIYRPSSWLVSDVPPSTTTPAFHVYQLLPAADPSFHDRHLLPSGGLSLSQAKFFGRLVLVLFDVIDLEVTVTDSTLLSGALHYWYRLLERFMSSTLWDDSAKRWTYFWTYSLRQLLSIFREWCRACERHPTGGFSDTPDISLTASYVAVAPFLHRAVLLSSDTRPRALQQLQLWKTRLDSSFEQALTGNWVLGTPDGSSTLSMASC